MSEGIKTFASHDITMTTDTKSMRNECHSTFFVLQ